MPLLLDLFCGAGGAAAGYADAGYTIVGVDHVAQPDYPYEFHQADAMTWPLDGFDVIHASPPCQSYSTMTNRHGSTHPRLIDPVLKRLRTHRCWVLENVLGANVDGILLTGAMFGLAVHRPRRFACSQLLWQPPTEPPPTNHVAVYGPPDGRHLSTRSDGSKQRAWASLEQGQDALETPWIQDWHQVREAIPPAYTRWIGEQLRG